MERSSYAIVVNHNPLRFWRRWEADVHERRSSSIWERPPIVRQVNDRPFRAFTRSGVILLAQLAIDEERRKRLRRLEADVIDVWAGSETASL